MTSLFHVLQDAYWGNLTQLPVIQLAAGLSNDAAAQVCCVSPHTYRRWRIDRPPNPACVRLLAIHAGYMPWTNWQHCQITRGVLYTHHNPSRGYLPNEIAGIDFIRQALTAITSENHRLRDRLSERQSPVWASGSIRP